MDNFEERTTLTPLTALILAVIFIQIVFIAATFFFLDDWSKRASFGDMFGGLNTFFAGLAFAGVIYTIFLQRKQLDLQRKELLLSRTEFVSSSETQNVQRFENTYFALLDFLNQVCEKITFVMPDSKESVTGRKCFEYLYDSLKLAIANGEYLNHNLLDSYNLPGYPHNYDRFFYDHRSTLNPFLDTFSQLMRFVDKEKLISKELYYGLISAQLTEEQLLIIFYRFGNIYRRDEYSGNFQFKEILSHSEIFKNLNTKKLIDESHRSWYVGIV